MEAVARTRLKKTMTSIVFIMLLSFLLAAPVPTNADRGGFGLSAQRVSETGQKAIAAGTVRVRCFCFPRT